MLSNHYANRSPWTNTEDPPSFTYRGHYSGVDCCPIHSESLPEVVTEELLHSVLSTMSTDGLQIISFGDHTPPLLDSALPPFPSVHHRHQEMAQTGIAPARSLHQVVQQVAKAKKVAVVCGELIKPDTLGNLCILRAFYPPCPIICGPCRIVSFLELKWGLGSDGVLHRAETVTWQPLG